MARYRMRIRTDWPATESFAFLSDLTNFPTWDPGVESAVQTVGDGPGLGAEYDVVASSNELHYVVDAFDAPHRIRARARNDRITSVDTISVSVDGTGSIVSYEADVTLNGILRIGDPILGLIFKRIGDRAADGLAKHLQGTRLT